MNPLFGSFFTLLFYATVYRFYYSSSFFLCFSLIAATRAFILLRRSSTFSWCSSFFCLRTSNLAKFSISFSISLAFSTSCSTTAASKRAIMVSYFENNASISPSSSSSARPMIAIVSSPSFPIICSSKEVFSTELSADAVAPMGEPIPAPSFHRI